jgi:choline dehydrogenase-like flavoprotein
MTRSLIIGSGPAAAGVALALVDDPDQQVTVLDIGHQVDAERRTVIDRMAGEAPDQWTAEDVEAIRAQPVGARTKGLPQKLSYGSDYPFEDVGQLHDVEATGHVNRSVVSGAYGGLSNVWGSQVMPFTSATFSRWPVSYDEMVPHYRAILSEIPYAGEEDALAAQFPLIGEATPLPPLAPRSTAVLDAADRNRAWLHGLGIAVGRARLAFDAGSCVRCGLCMTGCPYSLIYSAAQTFDRLRSEDRVSYHDGLMAVEVGQVGDTPFVMARESGSDRLQRFDADRIYLACGAVGTTRLVLSSLHVYDQDVQLGESAQFVVPMLSRRPVADPTTVTEFTLNQFNMVVTLDDIGLDVSQIHFYPHNPAMEEALPKLLQSPGGQALGNHVLRRLTVGLGYLPSWESPAIRMRVTAPDTTGGLAGIRLSGDERTTAGNPMFRKVVRRMLRAAPRLDLWPVLPMAFISAPGKSYHFGGSLPHRTDPADGPLTTDRQGRLAAWSKVHMVDASVFPTVPATTFTLTIMANAHRIARESMEADA